METFNMLLKLADSQLSGKPIVIFDKTSKELIRWIIIKEIRICDNAMIFVKDKEEEHSWLVEDWEFFTMEEFNKLTK